MRNVRLIVAISTLFAAFGAGAATFIIPEDDVLIARANAGIVSGTILDSRSELTPEGGVRTVTQLWVDRVLAGPYEVGQAVEIVEPGGETPTLSLQLHGVPRFNAGDRVLLMLTRNGRGKLETVDWALGKFTYRTADSGVEYLLRDEGNICGWAPGFKPYEEKARRADEFIRHIEDVVKGAKSNETYSEAYVDVCSSTGQTLTATPEAAIDYSFCSCRWTVFNPGPGSVTFLTSGTQTGIGNSLGAVDAGAGCWTADGGSSIVYQRGGTTAAVQAFISSDGINAIVFNDPSNEIDGAFTGSGVLGAGGPWYTNSSHTYNGSTFPRAIFNADVVVQNGVSNATGISDGAFEAMLAHELGHTLGFRHSNEAGAPGQTSAALMNSVLNRSSAFLSTWDSDAAAAMYGSGGAVCTGVAITAQPQSSSINSGQTKTLSVTVSGTANFTYQWFRGNSGDTSNSVQGPTSSSSTSNSFTTPALTTTTSYWVRVRNCSDANTVSSNTATVTVTCGPIISQQPQSVTIISGASTTLSVAVGAGSYTYQWYRGTAGNESDPVTGATSSSLNTGAITSSVSFWVMVTRTDCDPDVSTNSSTATVTICTPVEITTEPQDATVVSGNGTTLSVTASGTGTKTYQWYRGVSGNTSQKINGATSSSYFTGSLTSTSQFWVRVTNTCSGTRNDDSRTVTVTVQASCVAPVITQQPQSKTIGEGESTTLTVAATGTSLVYQWYVGESGNTLVPVGTNSPSFDTGVLTTTKPYWVRVSNSCGQKNSTTATVTVQPKCPAGALCALDGRFQLSLAVRDHRTGKTGEGTPLQQNDLFGYYSLPTFTGDATNPEVFVKMLDGRPINGNFWTFFGGLTDLEYTLTIKDTQTGGTKTYFKAGGSSAGGFDVGSGVTPETCAGEVDGVSLATEAPSVCSEQADRLCLSNGRFRITLTARDQRTGNTGTGQSIPQGAIFGYFSIPALTGNPSNPEVFVKIVDARGFNGFYWVFFSGLTDLEYTMTVTDTFTGKKKSYTKAAGSACGAFDTNAFTGQ